MTTVLSINPGHNGSTALIVDGILQVYIEEERLSRSKYDGNPYRGMLDLLTKTKIDFLVTGGTGQEDHRLPWSGESSYHALVRKWWPDVQVVNMNGEHHIGHAAAAFFGSGFDDAVAIIADGAGSRTNVPFNEDEPDKGGAEVYETESIYDCTWKEISIQPLYKRYSNNSGLTPNISTSKMQLDDTVTVTKAYEAVSQYLGFGFIEAGKTMGLAPYGKEDSNIPNLFFRDTGRGDKNVLIPNYPAGAFIDQGRFPYLQQKSDPSEWHKDSSKLPEVAKNLAWKVQKETQEIMGDLIEKAVDMSGKKNVVISGGYALNVVANYYYKERFPDLNIYIDPIAHDGGTAIGLGKLICYAQMGKEDKTKFQKDPLTSLYLGLHPNPDDYKVFTDVDDVDDVEIADITPTEVAQLIKDKNIVSIFQGRAEAGPRALGNRSILYDPTDPNGKDFVNTVKGREWFRPFAGTVMKEYANEWFDLRGMDDTPFMMYAVELQDKAVGEVPSITHVDGTCRIQTVTEEQNKHYYDLINEFYKLSGVPILFNTSFNLAGQPLVETLTDAIRTLSKSKLKYLYLPEIGKLFTVNIDNSEDEGWMTPEEAGMPQLTPEMQEVIKDQMKEEDKDG